MKKLSTILLAIVVGVAAAYFARTVAQEYKAANAQAALTVVRTEDLNMKMSAAYQDGLYLGRLDADGGRTEHAASGRWGQLDDKELFLSGYRQAYSEQTATRLGRTRPTSQALLRPELGN
jgi:hypothetical protein